jgi:hypothetical protein
VTVTEAASTGYVLTGFSCTDANAASTLNPASFGTFVAATRVGTVPATNVKSGADITCTFTNTRQASLTITKVSNGGVGTFNFTGNNGWTSQNIITTASGTGVPGTLQVLTAAAATTITETAVSGYVMSAVNCAGTGGGTQPTVNLTNRTIAFTATQLALGSNVTCTVTNTKLPTITLTKISVGSVGTFTFTGGNGWANQSIVTTTSGVGVAGPLQTLTAVGTATTLTETAVAGFTMTDVTCSGTGNGTQPNVNLGNRTIAFTAAQLNAGANVTCTVTNSSTSPTLSIVKTAQLVKASGNTNSAAQLGDTINYSYVVTNTGGVSISNVEVADVHSGLGAFSDPAHVTLTDNATIGDSPDGNANNTIWGTLAPLDAISFQTSYIVVQGDIDAQ